MRGDLFIVGNGFDSGHNMDTSYDNFKEWLLDNYPEAEDEYDCTPMSVTQPDGDERISDEDAARFIVHTINETTNDKWSDFESALGKIDWLVFFDEVDDIEDSDGETDLWKTAYAREDFGSNLFLNSRSFSQLFSQWINEIDYPEGISANEFLSLEKLTDSLFLTFNYTRTLEDIYHVNPANICHIHGVQGREIIIGHGESRDTSEDHEDRFDFGMDAISEIHDALRKPTAKIIEDNALFFARIHDNDIHHIYSWGFSFSNVDLCYIQRICQVTDTQQIVWHLYEYKPGSCKDFPPLLRGCGFKGEIETFTN